MRKSRWNVTINYLYQHLYVYNAYSHIGMHKYIYMYTYVNIMQI